MRPISGGKQTVLSGFLAENVRGAAEAEAGTGRG